MSAQGFVFLHLAKHHTLLSFHNAMAHVSQRTALNTNGMHLCYVVGNGAQCRHRTERHTFKVHVKACNDNANASVGQFVANGHQPLIHKLRLINAHHVDVCRKQQYRRRRIHGRAMNGIAVVAHNVVFRKARINGRLENLNPLFGKHGTFHTPYQLLSLARKHRATNHFHSSLAVVLASCIINHTDAKVQKDVLKIANKRLLFLLLGIYIAIFAYNMGILYIVPTPVGNMEDITLRAIRTLKEADLVLAEDTRTTGILLKHLGIEVAHLQSHHKFNEHGTSAGIVERLKAGQNIALVSDAGTPGISDPGFFLAREAVAAGITVNCLPGATACIPAVVSSGMPCDRFCFEGFIPQKKGRKTYLENLKDEQRTMVFYESPYRLLKTLTQLAEAVGPERQVCVCREISKLHEENVRGTLQEVAKHFEQTPPRGEIVIVLAGTSSKKDKKSKGEKL